MKRTLLIISLIFFGFSSKGQNLTFVDANNLVINSTNWNTYWKPQLGEVWKVERISGTYWATTSHCKIWINTVDITQQDIFPVWIGSSDSIKIKPYGSGLTVDSDKQAFMNYLIFKNEP